MAKTEYKLCKFCEIHTTDTPLRAQISNLRQLRLGEEKKKKEKERNNRTKTY